MTTVPDRQVQHDQDDDGDDLDTGHLVGDITTLEMTETEKRAARKREATGRPFGFHHDAGR